MRQYKTYKIFVVESEQSQNDVKSEKFALMKKGAYAEAKKLQYDAIRQTDNSGSASTAKYVKDYEDTMCRLLAKIHNTPFGQIFFRTLNPKTEIWITPREPENSSSAITMPLDYQTKPYAPGSGSGSTQILFRPNDHFDDTVLLHELIHAYRYSYNKFVKYPVGTDFGDTEEFIATLMENIYRCSTGRLPLNGYEGAPVPIDDAYAPFRDKGNIRLISALKHFMKHEYLAILMSNLPNVEYNPFRDFPTLYQGMLNRLNEGVEPNFRFEELGSYPY